MLLFFVATFVVVLLNTPQHIYIYIYVCMNYEPEKKDMNVYKMTDYRYCCCAVVVVVVVVVFLTTPSLDSATLYCSGVNARPSRSKVSQSSSVPGMVTTLIPEQTHIRFFFTYIYMRDEYMERVVEWLRRWTRDLGVIYASMRERDRRKQYCIKIK